jgi:uncharacterized protein YndB with AHSA1/START domain
METIGKTVITVETHIEAPIAKVWKYWNEPKHITQWYHASDDWHAPAAENDLRIEGKFKTRMAAKDGSMAFDFEGVYTNVVASKLIEFDILDGRKVKIEFTSSDNETKVTEGFEAESTHPVEMQRGGWQSILNNFKKYTEAN